MDVPLLDLKRHHAPIMPQLESALQRVLRSGTFVLGPEGAALEAEIAAATGARYAAGLASGSDALLLSLLASGIGAGDEVLVPAYTFVATAGSVARTGATPVFVDIVRQTFCMDLADAASKIGPATRAIIPVHLFGHPADMDPLRTLARDHGLVLIEDAAQALGARYDGRPVGSLGDIACLSFYPTKNLGGFGDGGMLLSNDADLVARVRMLANHGQAQRYLPEVIGLNSRLDEFQAAALRVELPMLDGWNQRRRDIAARYHEGLQGTPVTLPAQAEGCEHVYHLFTIRVADRDRVRADLTAAGIGTAIHYPLPLSQTKAFRRFASGPTPQAEAAAAEVLCVPMFPELQDDEVDRVIDAIRRATS